MSNNNSLFLHHIPTHISIVLRDHFLKNSTNIVPQPPKSKSGKGLFGMFRGCLYKLFACSALMRKPIRQPSEKWAVASAGNLYLPSHHRLAAMHASISGHLYSQSDSLGKKPNSFSVSLAVAPPAEPPALAADPDPPEPSPPIPEPDPGEDWEELWEPMPVVTLAFTCRSNCCSSAFLVRWISSHVKEMSPGSFRMGSSTRLIGLERHRWKSGCEITVSKCGL